MEEATKYLKVLPFPLKINLIKTLTAVTAGKVCSVPVMWALPHVLFLFGFVDQLSLTVPRLPPPSLCLPSLRRRWSWRTNTSVSCEPMHTP